jgi:hypothetical protein
MNNLAIVPGEFRGKYEQAEERYREVFELNEAVLLVDKGKDVSQNKPVLATGFSHRF